jgi:hypothetical protein
MQKILATDCSFVFICKIVIFVNFWIKIWIFYIWPTRKSKSATLCKFFLHSSLADMFTDKINAKVPCNSLLLSIYLLNSDFWSIFDQKLQFFQLWPFSKSKCATLCKFWLCTQLVDMFNYKSTKGFPTLLCSTLYFHNLVFFNFWPTRFMIKCDHFEWK